LKEFIGNEVHGTEFQNEEYIHTDNDYKEIKISKESANVSTLQRSAIVCETSIDS
jgi:hypothetical protein